MLRMKCTLRNSRELKTGPTLHEVKLEEVLTDEERKQLLALADAVPLIQQAEPETSKFPPIIEVGFSTTIAERAAPFVCGVTYRINFESESPAEQKSEAGGE